MTARSAILREDTGGLSVIRPTALAFTPSALESEQHDAVCAGYEAGYEAGLERAREEAATLHEAQRDRLTSALAALDGATAAAASAVARRRAELERGAIELAFSVLEAMLARELLLARSPGREAIERALAELPAGSGVIARVNPADADALATADAIERVTTIVADPQIPAGGCEIEFGETLVDARVDTALERVRAVLDEAVTAR